jgi:hypothetical protein
MYIIEILILVFQNKKVIYGFENEFPFYLITLFSFWPKVIALINIPSSA